MTTAIRRPRWRAGLWTPLLLALLTGLIPLRALVMGEVLVPAGLLRYLAPWSAAYPDSAKPPWNPLMYDSVGQFYPWRDFAGRTYRDGLVPLWNPHQFCGTPFLANSQSAVLYPGNLLYWLLPADVAAAPTVWLHLFLAALFMWMFLRGCGVGNLAGATGGLAFALSTWQIAWLSLPTFLCTSCWLPLSAHLVRRTLATGSLAAAAGLASALGMALLGGHLQIAFYVLAATLALALAELWSPRRAGCKQWKFSVLPLGVAILGSFLIAAPQVLPAVEFSRVSHRAGPATSQGYAAYIGYAAGTGQLATLFLPDFLGNPSRGDLPYRGTSQSGALFNYAEGALYVGIVTFLLAGYALVRRRQPAMPIAFLAALACVSLSLAFGTRLNSIIYYYVPGFAQSGSPGRVLVLWAFSLAALAGAGLNKLLEDEATPVRSAVAAVLLAAGLLLSAFWLGGKNALEMPAEIMPAYTADMARQTVLLLLGAVLVIAAASGWGRVGWRRLLLPGLLVSDLVAVGLNFTPSSPRGEVYPSTTLTEKLRTEVGHNRIAPINTDWSFEGPRAVLPPNAAMVYGLYDVQGYDSLFWRGYKRLLNTANGRDSSPPEVGNMVFAMSPSALLWQQMGVTHLLRLAGEGSSLGLAEDTGHVSVVAVPDARGRARLENHSDSAHAVRWVEDRATRVTLDVEAPTKDWLVLSDVLLPGWGATVNDRPAAIDRADGVFRRVPIPAGRSVVEFRYQPTSFRIGLFLMLLSIGALAACAAAAIRAQGRPVEFS